MSQGASSVASKSDRPFPKLDNYQGVGSGIFLRDAAQQGCCARAYMDVFTAIPQKDSAAHAGLLKFFDVG